MVEEQTVPIADWANKAVLAKAARRGRSATIAAGWVYSTRPPSDIGGT